MAREIVKARRVGQSLVITLPLPILEVIAIQEGDRVMVETDGTKRLIVRKEEERMKNTSRRLELEIDLLEARKKALDADADFKMEQWNRSTPVQADAPQDDDSMALTMRELNLRTAKLARAIAKRRLALYDATGD
ncbi:MAG: AbrB/MazE/SpoVT family DNA-binding domain-containing protein [Bryobacterales bacterium]|nr:AbrB/MazE/SpoVT family DNA-binding domain-containing protein [Bryobacterales bacterium]